MAFNSSSPYPEGVISFLDTDLYKLTMQCAVHKYFSKVHVTYTFKNRTPEKKLSRKAFDWLEKQIGQLGNISLFDEEYTYLKTHCPHFSNEYLEFLREFRLAPRDQVRLTFHPDDSAAAEQVGRIDIHIEGLWQDTILYEIPVLALTSEAYFKFMDMDWDYEGQEEKAYEKGMRLLEAGCDFSEYGARRRRDYHTQALVFRGLTRASKEAEKRGLPGKLSGTSNVHLAMRFGIPPVGTVGHEWFMGIAAITRDYKNANEEALRYWVSCFGEGVMDIGLTDTFGTPDFLKAFSKPLRHLEDNAPMLPLTGQRSLANSSTTVDEKIGAEAAQSKTYAHVFKGVRQDSGDPKNYIKMLRRFYDGLGIREKKVIVFSDALNIERCLEYKKVSEENGFQPTFGVGTFLTNDFVRKSTGAKSTPLNIVIKLSSAMGNPAIKISDNIGKNSGDPAEVRNTKAELGYDERDWAEGDESSRWGKDDENVTS